MSQLLPRSAHSPPTQPQLSQTRDPEEPPVTPVIARQNIEPRDDAEMLTSEMHDPYTRTTGA